MEERKALEDLTDELESVADGLERKQRCLLPVVEPLGDKECVVAVLDYFGVDRMVPRIRAVWFRVEEHGKGERGRFGADALDL